MRLITQGHTASNQFKQFTITRQVDGYTEQNMLSIDSSGRLTVGSGSNVAYLSYSNFSGGGISAGSGSLTVGADARGANFDALIVSGGTYTSYFGTAWLTFRGNSSTPNDAYYAGLHTNLPANAGSEQTWSIRYAFWKTGSRQEVGSLYMDGSLSVGDVTKENTAILNCVSTTKGALFPRMTNTQWGLISSKAEGLQGWSTDDHAVLWFDGTDTIGFRYNRSTSKFQGFDGTNWNDLN